VRAPKTPAWHESVTLADDADIASGLGGAADRLRQRRDRHADDEGDARRRRAGSGGGGGAGGTPVDAGDRVADAGTSPDGPASIPTAGWLIVKGNRILTDEGKPFHGRGANLHDTRSCNACTGQVPDVAGWKRWADELVDNWHANFIRFDLEAYADDAGYRKQWKSLGVDDGYLADIKTMVSYLTGKPGVYVLVTLFEDPAIKPNNSDPDSEWPTDAAGPLYTRLAEALFADPHVLFGLANEPHGPADRNPDLVMAYQKAIDLIRGAETAHGSQKHVIVVQAPQGYARDLTYFMANPMPGENIAYEIHPYNPKADFDKLIVQPSQKLPVIIGEYGPAGAMTDDDIRAMWMVAQANEVPHVAWNFHMRCAPDMLQDTAKDGCGLAASAGYTFPRTPWGDLFRGYLATPW
jgi:hypothetical protein